MENVEIIRKIKYNTERTYIHTYTNILNLNVYVFICLCSMYYESLIDLNSSFFFFFIKYNFYFYIASRN